MTCQRNRPFAFETTPAPREGAQTTCLPWTPIPVSDARRPSLPGAATTSTVAVPDGPVARHALGPSRTAITGAVAALLLVLVAPGRTSAQEGPPRADAPAADTIRADTTAAAQTSADTFALPGIVVTATRVPLTREAVPTPVTVWTREELQERGIHSVAEALAAIPAATVARAGSRGAQTSLFLRGGESDYVKVLIDGVAVNDPGGAFDYADLSTDQVERIEVVRGPVSVLYGSDAVSGVVQIFTRRAAGAPTITTCPTRWAGPGPGRRGFIPSTAIATTPRARHGWPGRPLRERIWP